MNEAEGPPRPPEGQPLATKEVFQPGEFLKEENEYKNPLLNRAAKQLDRNPPEINTPAHFRQVHNTLEERVILGEIPEEAAGLLLKKIEDKIRGLEAGGGKERDPLTGALEGLSVKLGDLVQKLEQSGQLQPALTPDQIAKMSKDQALTESQLRTAQLREAFGRLAPEEEKDRWIEVELALDFYTRFSPNQEPYFYTKSSRREREKWDARWRLARAAFYKKMYSAFPDKLVENQDLIELKKEEMESLYNTEGVRKALEWYVAKIVKGEEIKGIKRKMGLDEAREYGGKRFKREDMNFFECEDGDDFRGIRKALRLHLFETVFKDEPRKDKEQMRTLLMKIKSADAIAWNWIWCSNLVESVDSRYSPYEGSKERHGSLPPVVCSDDLRAVFHPQEKFEDKCTKGQQWGNFGRWGLTQMERIMQPFTEEEKERWDKEEEEREKATRENRKRVQNNFKYEYIFEGASSLNDFWTVGQPSEGEPKEVKNGEIIERNYTKKIPVKVPECYPTTSMKSFWEVYREKKYLLERLKDKKGIDWKAVAAEPWKTDYLTIKLRKAVGLFDVFTKESKEGWARALLDIYTRLGIYRGEDDHSVLRDYYESLGYSGKEAGRLAGIHFHNLKVWAVYATRGGVGRPQDSRVTDPYSRSASEVVHRWHRSDHEAILRKPYVGYLEDNGLFQREDLVVKSIE